MARFVIPLGAKYVFDPEDHELMVYLFCKANGEQLPCDDFIVEIDLYNIIDPGKLFINIDSKENTIYIFTKVKKVSEKGKNVNRKVSANRFWKGLDRGQPIYNKTGCLVGHKRKFSFMNNMKMNLGYHMTEFVLDEESLGKAKFKDYVVCRIKRNLKKVRGGETDFGFQENPPATVLPPATPSDNTSLAASLTAASNLLINNGEKDSAGLSDPPLNSYSQYDGEESLNVEDYTLPELPEDIDESMIQDLMNVYNNIF